MTARPSTLAALAGTFDWTGRSGRLAFGLSFAGVIVALMLIGATEEIALNGFIIFALVAVLVFVFIAQTRLRVRDLDWPGGLTWLICVPGVMIVLAVVLMVRKPAEIPRSGEKAYLRRIGFGVAVALALLVASRVFWTPIWIPSGSMKPTFLVGDYSISLKRGGAPERGDLIVYDHPVSNREFIGRVIAIGGDSIAMQDGVVVLNGDALVQSSQPDFIEVFERQGPAGSVPRCANGVVAMGEDCINSRATETLPNGRSYDVLDIGPSRFDHTPAFDVPQGHVFVLGDNRDNSVDSRMAQVAGGVGFVPEQNVLSRPRVVLFNFDFRPGRILKVVQ